MLSIQCIAKGNLYPDYFVVSECEVCKRIFWNSISIESYIYLKKKTDSVWISLERPAGRKFEVTILIFQKSFSKVSLEVTWKWATQAHSRPPNLALSTISILAITHEGGLCTVPLWVSYFILLFPPSAFLKGIEFPPHSD